MHMRIVLGAEGNHTDIDKQYLSVIQCITERSGKYDYFCQTQRRRYSII